MSWLDGLFSLFSAASAAPTISPTAQATNFDPSTLEAAGVSPGVAQAFFGDLNAAMNSNDIVTPVRVAMFVAQVAYESNRFTRLSEIWGPTPQQLRYERDPAAAWPPTAQDQRNALAYTLGNAALGDGLLWRGHGLIQITGYTNHLEEAQHFDVPMNDIGRWLQTAHGACESAAWFWFKHGCNELADAVDFAGVTRRINGGLASYQGRLAIYEAVKTSMGIA